MKKALIIGLLAMALIACREKAVKEENTEIEIDSSEIRKNIDKDIINQIKAKEHNSLILDSVHLKYSFEFDSLIGKPLIVSRVYPRDIYKSVSGYRIILYKPNLSGRFLIEVNCTKEQAELIALQKPRLTWLYYSIIPKYIRKINLNLVAYVNKDDEENTDAYIELETSPGYGAYKVGGDLVSVTPIQKLY